jgi:hypothetical protein
VNNPTMELIRATQLVRIDFASIAFGAARRVQDHRESLQHPGQRRRWMRE